MQKLKQCDSRHGKQPLIRVRRVLPMVSSFLALATILPGSASAAGVSPWENAVNALQQSFTGPLAHGLSLVAIVVGGLTLAYGEGDKRMLGGIVFGVAMAAGAAQIYLWLFS